MTSPSESAPVFAFASAKTLPSLMTPLLLRRHLRSFLGGVFPDVLNF